MSSSSLSFTPANFDQQVITLKTLGGNSERFFVGEILKCRDSGVRELTPLRIVFWAAKYFYAEQTPLSLAEASLRTHEVSSLSSLLS